MSGTRNFNKTAQIAEPGMIKSFSFQAQLIFKLIKDPRVNLFVKLLPIGSLVYFISPDFFPFILDDAGVIGVGLYLFLELCPADIVEEHKRDIWGVLTPEINLLAERLNDEDTIEQEKSDA